MSEHKAKVEMAKLNKQLSELWIDEVDLLEIHRNASWESDKKCTPAINRMHDQLNECKAILRGQELRKVFGYE